MSIQRSIVSLLSEVHVIQNQLTQLTGVTLNLATLDILTITSTTGVISLTTSTVTVEEAMTESQKVINDIQFISYSCQYVSRKLLCH